jgi:hypothetical protein
MTTLRESNMAGWTIPQFSSIFRSCRLPFIGEFQAGHIWWHRVAGWIHLAILVIMVIIRIIVVIAIIILLLLIIVILVLIVIVTLVLYNDNNTHRQQHHFLRPPINFAPAALRILPCCTTLPAAARCVDMAAMSWISLLITLGKNHEDFFWVILQFYISGGFLNHGGILYESSISFWGFSMK